MKRILALVLATALLIGSLGMTTAAAPGCPCTWPPHEYNHDVATFAAQLSYWAYEQDEIAAQLTERDFTNIAQHNFAQTAATDTVALTLALRDVIVDDEEMTLLVLALRGTVGHMISGAEWRSNYNVGEEELHVGFMLAAQNAREYLYAFALYHALDIENTVMLITGHSRGGAVANILGAHLNGAQSLVLQENLHVYTFASPRTTRSPNPAYTNIINIINVHDRVPRLPRTMGFRNLWGRHGNDLAVHMTTTTIIGIAIDVMYHHSMENYLRWMFAHPGLTYDEFRNMSVPITTIFGTTWPATWYNWLLFWLAFGWIWMYLWV
ncbi:MAG: hypothetical protein FWB76_01810 [Oscillospiraceae bacterium]|nr:hypothetical protein [Oscillospiraceae bacterium]